MNLDQEQKLTNIFRVVFNQNDLVLYDDMVADDVAGWDSFNHVNLIIQIEQQFGVQFSNEEVNNFKNVGELKFILNSKLTH